MVEDASLEDFVGSAGAEEDETVGDAGGDEGSDEEPADDVGDEEPGAPPPAGDPARTTYQWAGSGVACDACGARTERRWRDGDALVCPDCKAW